MSKANKKRAKKRAGYRFEIIVERDSILHEIAQQTLKFEYADRDMLYYSGNLRQKNTYDELILDYAPELQRERRSRLRQRRMRL